MSALAGHFYIPTEFEENGSGPRVYTGFGDPNDHMDDIPPFFIPMPRPGDRYLQLDTDPITEWVFTIDEIWVEISNRYDTTPPDDTDIYQIIY